MYSERREGMVASLITVSFTDSQVTLAGWLAIRSKQVKASACPRPQLLRSFASSY
jgi:hypothetical protein